MPDYKRKKTHSAPRGKGKKPNKTNEIRMSPSKTTKRDITQDESVRVIKGKKFFTKQRIKISCAFIAVISAILLILSFALPVGLVENVVNTFASIGSGEFPLNIVGTSVLNLHAKSGYYYVLTDTDITAYSNSGKNIFSFQHGFAAPVLTTSATRALVFEQGGDTAHIFNLSGLIDTKKTENSIINASISRNGSYALVTKSDDYASQVSVYNKNSKLVYEWNSAKDIIGSAVIASNGKKIAVSTLNASAGDFVSKVKILNFNSADPLYTVDLGNTPTLSLLDMGHSLSVVTDNGCKFVKWSNYSTKDFEASGQLSMVRRNAGNLLLVYNRSNDKSDNLILVLSKNGRKISEFKINSQINDIAYSSGYVYCVSDTSARIFDKSGNVTREDTCEYGCVRISVIGSHTIALLSDNNIFKIEIKKGE